MGDNAKSLERFMQSPAYKRIEQELEQEEAAKEGRREKALELVKLKAERPKVMAALAEEEKEATEALKAAKEDLKMAQGAYTLATGKAYGQAWQFDQAIRGAEAYLLATAPRPLLDALERTKEKLERCRGKPFCGRDIEPDIPTAFSTRYLDQDGTIITTPPPPWSERRKKWGPTERQERLAELAAIQAEIDALEARIFSGE
jgi:hypothetical protein